MRTPCRVRYFPLCIVFSDIKLTAFPTGHVKLAPLPKREAGKPRPQREASILAQTDAAQCINYREILTLGEQGWFKCKELIALSGDACRIHSWVFFRSSVGL